MIKTFLLVGVAACLAGAQPRVVVVGIDGLGGEMLREQAPQAFQELMRRGTWTLRARGVLPTVSSPNWASMIMGAGPERHGVTSNDWQPSKYEIGPVCQGSDGRFPTIFGVLHAQKPELHAAVIHDWDGFGRLVEPGAARAVRHVPGSAKTIAAAIAYWRTEKPDLLFIHLDDVDHAGHDSGWSGPAYRAAVDKAGVLLKELQEALLEPEDLAGRRPVYLLVTADHGGTGKSHGHETQRDLEIPWILTGPGVPAGQELRAAVYTIDTAATLAHLFQVEPHPCWSGRAVQFAKPIH